MEMEITGNEPAMPYDEYYWEHGERTLNVTYTGLTIRQQFTMAAMQGMLSNHALIDTASWDWIAKNSIAQADQLIKALNETPNPNNNE